MEAWTGCKVTSFCVFMSLMAGASEPANEPRLPARLLSEVGGSTMVEVEGVPLLAVSSCYAVITAIVSHKKYKLSRQHGHCLDSCNACSELS